jgi:nitrogen regulatory protein PII
VELYDSKSSAGVREQLSALTEYTPVFYDFLTNIALRSLWNVPWRTMKKIEAIVDPSRLDAMKQALRNLDVEAITISDVEDLDGATHASYTYRGVTYSRDVCIKKKVEALVHSFNIDEVIAALSAAARSEHSRGVDRIVVCDVTQAIRITTRFVEEFPMV